METIVAGRFEILEKADAAVRQLIAAGFRHDDASAFFVNPPGQHAERPVRRISNAPGGHGKTASG